LLKDRSEHIQAQQSRQNLYYVARARAKENPENFLCIIHNKIDQNKTWLPRHDKIKSLSDSNIIPLPISLTGMITYGRQPRMFSHYALTRIWPSDPDFIVTSIAKCLRDLENYNGDMSGHLGIFLEDDAHPLFS
jgi:hypothetical protein